MKKSYLKAIFINAKATGAKYIGVRIETEGSSRPECIINPRENFDAKYDYYMKAYDDDLRLIATKGKGLKRKSRSVSSVIMTPIEEHSKKPDETRKRIEALYGDVPKIELFARRQADNWDCWGNEV